MQSTKETKARWWSCKVSRPNRKHPQSTQKRRLNKRGQTRGADRIEQMLATRTLRRTTVCVRKIRKPPERLRGAVASCLIPTCTCEAEQRCPRAPGGEASSSTVAKRSSDVGKCITHTGKTCESVSNPKRSLRLANRLSGCAGHWLNNRCPPCTSRGGVARTTELRGSELYDHELEQRRGKVCRP